MICWPKNKLPPILPWMIVWAHQLPHQYKMAFKKMATLKNMWIFLNLNLLLQKPMIKKKNLGGPLPMEMKLYLLVKYYYYEQRKLFC